MGTYGYAAPEYLATGKPLYLMSHLIKTIVLHTGAGLCISNIGKIASFSTPNYFSLHVEKNIVS
jgi:hypothetical protein